MTTTKPASRARWHERTGHANYRDLQLLPKLTQGVVVFSDSKNRSCVPSVVCIREENPHRHHSKIPPTYAAYQIARKRRLHWDLGDILVWSLEKQFAMESPTKTHLVYKKKFFFFRTKAKNPLGRTLNASEERRYSSGERKQTRKTILLNTYIIISMCGT